MYATGVLQQTVIIIKEAHVNLLPHSTEKHPLR
jgi:hypothetical protein